MLLLTTKKSRKRGKSIAVVTPVAWFGKEGTESEGKTYASEGDTEQSMRLNLPVNIKAWIQLEALVTYEGSTEVLGSLKSLLAWKH